MRRFLKRCAVWTLAAALAVAPVAADAATYQYFRMYGGGQNSGTVVGPPPVGTLSYSVSGPATAVVGQPYAATSSVGGAVGSTAFSVYSGTFPPGLALDPSSGAISGSPTQAGSYSPILVVTDSQAHQGFASWSLTVSPGLAVAGSPSSAATVGQSYAAQFSASGGASPYTFSTSSALPPGLTLSASGLLSGSPNASGTYSNIVVQVTDSAAATASSAAFTINVASPLAVSWAPAAGQVGVVYAPAAPSVSGGRAPYLYSLNGQVPSGLVFDNSTGDLNGTPSTAGSYSLGVTAIDADGRSAASGLQTLSIAAGAPPPQQGSTLAFSALPSTAGQLGVGYLSHAAASGGTSPYTFSSIGAALPPGLTLSSDGTLSGTPSQLGTFAGIQLAVADAVGGLAQTSPFSITISQPPPLTVSGNPSTSAQVGASYTATFTAFDGTGAGYTFSLAAGSLPPGLTLSNVGGASGAIAGTPTTVGTYAGLQVEVTDSGGDTALSAVFSITVAAPAGPTLAISGNPAPYGTVGQPYSAQLSASGGTGTGYVFTVASGGLPAGLSMSSSGAISGTPTAAGSASFGVQVVDSAGDTALASFSILAASASAAIAAGQPVRSGDAVSGTLSTDLPSPAWSFSPAAFGFAASGSAFTGTAPQVAAQTAYSVVATASTAGYSVAAPAVPVEVYPALAVSSGPSGTVSGIVGEAFGPTPAPVPSGAVGTVSYGIYAAGAAFDLAAGCPGLALDATSGALSGTPTAPCSPSQLYLVATDSFDGRQAASGYFAIAVAADTATAALTTPAEVRSGAAVSGALSTNLPGAVWSFAATPSGLSLAASGSTFSGAAPQVAAQTVYSVVATATAGAASAAAAPFSLTVDPPLAVSGGPSGTVSGDAGAAIASTPAVSAGAVGTVSYALLQSGSAASLSSLCPGLSFSTANGVLSGTPTAACSVSGLTIQATDSYDGATATTSPAFAVAIAATQAAPTGSFASSAVAGAAYSSGPLAASGGTAPYAWSLASGALPPGLTLSSAGVLSGTPTTAGTYTFAVKATDAVGTVSPNSAAQSVTVTQTPSVAGSYGSAAEVGVAYSSAAPSLTGGPGTPPYTYNLYSGTLPPGLSLAANGVLSGTPTAAGTYTFYVSLKDANNVGSASAGPQQSITVAAALAISGTPPGGTAGSAYSFAPTVSGGSGGNSFTVANTSGTLAAIGLSLNASTGVISGTAAAGSWSGTITVSDARGGHASLGASISVVSTVTPGSTTYSSSGSFTVPNYNTLVVEVFGAGGGGGGFGGGAPNQYYGGTGGTAYFYAPSITLYATGGTGGGNGYTDYMTVWYGAAGSNGSGGNGDYNAYGGGEPGGAGYYGGGDNGGNGGTGGYAKKTWTRGAAGAPVPGAAYSAVVPGGGAAGYGDFGAVGAAGAQGYVRFTWN